MVAATLVAEQELRGARATFAKQVVATGGDDIETSALETNTPVEVRSPIDGRVLQVMRETEGPVAAGVALVELGDLRDLEIVADYLTSDAVQIRSGMPARLEGWGGATLSARVRRVEPSGVTKVSALGVEEQRVDVILDLDDAGLATNSVNTGLGDGFRVEVRVVTWSAESVLVLPEGALFRGSSGDGSWAVFRFETGRAVETPVRIGHRNGLQAEILEGVREGEEIIVHPPDAIEDGVRIRVRATEG